MNAVGSKQSNSKEGRTTLLGLVRRVSRTGKARESRENGTRLPSESPLDSLGGYRKVTPNVAPASTYSSPPPSTSNRERIVWGRPPATTSEGRTIEGIELVDEGPSLMSGAHHPLKQVQRLSSRPKKRNASPSPFKKDPIEEVPSAELPGRRSMDSLFSSMNVVSILPHHNHPSTSATTNPRRSMSVRVSGPKQRLGHSNSISSTPRAKPANENAVPIQANSPYQGYWTTERSSSVDDEKTGQIGSSKEDHIRETFKGKGSVWAVARGWKKGIVLTFEEAEQQTRDFPGPILRQFDNVDEAIEFLKTTNYSARPGPTANGNDDSSTGARFTSPVQRRTSVRLPGSSDGTNDASIKRTLRSPSTNPFLTEIDRNVPFDNGTTSPLHDLQRSFSANGYLLPPSVISSTSPSSQLLQDATSVAVRSIVACQDLDQCVSFYRDVLGFTIHSDLRHKGEILLTYSARSPPSLILRLKTPTSPSKTTNTSKIPMSMYRSSISLNMGSCDMHQLHADISRKLLQFQSDLQSTTTRRGSFSQLRVEEIEIKPWGSLEFLIFDLEGNMISISGSDTAPNASSTKSAQHRTIS